MLTIEGVRYRYVGAPRPSLIDIDLHIADGEVVGLAGPSEAGKSTLCLVASGLAPRAIRGELTGRYSLDGRDVADVPMHELIEQVGICFEDPTTQLSGVSGTVYEEVAFGLMNLGRPRDEILQRTEDTLRLLGIEGLQERDPARLSGGQAQLVALGGVMAMGPRHLILDEPTAQLDPRGTQQIADAIARVASMGGSILIAEQKVEVLERICHRIVVLSGGRVAFEGPTETVLSDPRLIELGVSEPAGVRLRRLAREAGIDPTALDAAA